MEQPMRGIAAFGVPAALSQSEFFLARWKTSEEFA